MSRAAARPIALALLACAGALPLFPGCAPEEPSCGLAVVADQGGWVPVVAPDAPLAVGDLRRVMCVRGIAPCDGTPAPPASADETVLRVLPDATVPWVYYLAAVAPGRVEVRQTCADRDEAVYALEVR